MSDGKQTLGERLEASLPLNDIVPLGWVVQSSASSLTLSVSNDSAGSSADGGRQGAHVGQYVIVDCSGAVVIGQIGELHLGGAASGDGAAGALAVQSVVACVELMATLDLESGELIAGVLKSARIGSQVFSAPGELVRRVMESRVVGDEAGRTSKVRFNMARLADGSHLPVELAAEKLIGRHCCVVGTSGGGKSWTLARIVEQVAKFNSKVIVFDPSGEFHTMESVSRHLYVGDDPEPAPNASPVAVPYYHLIESDLFAIFKPSGPSQGPKLRDAMKSLKLARCAPELALEGLIVKADRSKLEFERAYGMHIETLENPYANFDITKLPRQIENECVLHQRSPVEAGTWGGLSGQDLSCCVSLVNRVQDIITSKSLEAIFQPGELPSLFKEINAFLTDPQANVLRISLKYLPFDHNAREIVANALGRHLLSLARRDIFRQKPLLVVLDESHQFLKAALGEGENNYPLESFALAAKEGRKYSLTLCLATQRPRDIPEAVLSQMGTMIVHRLISHNDRDVVERASVGLDKHVSGALPTLAPGEAVILGVDFPVPLFVYMEPPACKPDSRGPDYQRFWG